MVRILSWAAVAALVSSCFDPAIGDGVYTCGAEGLCPPGMVCDPADNMCRRQLRDGGDDAASVPDAAGTDAALCPGWSYAPANVDPCDPGLPDPETLPFEIPSGQVVRYDSTTSQITVFDVVYSLPSALVTQSDGSQARVLHVDAIDIPVGATLDVVGSYPVILLVSGAATIDGVMRVSSGADVALACATASGQGEPSEDIPAADDRSTGGGAGGGFGAAGGAGGVGVCGDECVPPVAPSAGAGAVNGEDPLSPLRGGCAGGAAGNITGLEPALGGAGGSGGGALQVSARDALAVSGMIRADGQGGRGGTVFSAAHIGTGGGGGGSGGAIALEAASTTLAEGASLCANGGGGGGGGQPNTMVLDGSAGAAGTCSQAGAAGGASRGSGVGGDGGAAGGPTGSPGGDGELSSVDNPGAGGGGGGAVGRIRIRGLSAPIEGVTISPDPAID